MPPPLGTQLKEQLALPISSIIIPILQSKLRGFEKKIGHDDDATISTFSIGGYWLS